jgi:hypothetical protein
MYYIFLINVVVLAWYVPISLGPGWVTSGLTIDNNGILNISNTSVFLLKFPFWIFWVTLLCPIVYYIDKFIFGFEANKDVNKITTEYLKLLKVRQEDYNNDFPSTQNLHKKIENHLYKFEATYSTYLSLRGHSKYSLTWFRINLDWYRYQYAHSKLIENYSDYITVTHQEVLGTAIQNEHNADRLIERTESRFKHLSSKDQAKGLPPQSLESAV